MTVFTAGHADRAVIRFSPQLEAMQYTDPYGNVYDYAEKAGRRVNFPGDATLTLDPAKDISQVSWDYMLPLAPSTKDWEDTRLGPAYRMTVTVYRGTSSVTYTVNDIDITGNIYDLVYIQPMN